MTHSTDRSAPDDEVCGGCGHTAKEHILEVGCISGWTYDDQGIALVPDGCPCRWAHVSSPTRKQWIIETVDMAEVQA